MINNNETYKLYGSIEEDRFYEVCYDSQKDEFFRSGVISGAPAVNVTAIQAPDNVAFFGFQVNGTRRFLYPDPAGNLRTSDQIMYFILDEIGAGVYNVSMLAQMQLQMMTMNVQSPVNFAADKKPPKQKWKFVHSTINPDKEP